MTCRHGPCAILTRCPCRISAVLVPCHHRPSALLPRTLCTAITGLRADVGKGRACPTRLLDGELLLLVRAYALSNVVGQTPSYCFAVPPPSSGPLVLSLLFARKPVGAWHSRFGQPSPNILPRATRRAFRGIACRNPCSSARLKLDLVET